MAPMTDSERAHEAARELIPWWVTGRLSEAEGRQVESHLAQCAECRADVEVERRVVTAVRHRSPVAYVPQVSMQKLLSRIEDVEREMPTRPVPEPARPNSASILAAGARLRLAAGMLLGVGLGLLAAAGWQATQTGAPAPYSTASTAETPTGRPAQLRVVFAPAISVEDLARVVAGNGLVIVDGPSESGVYGLAMAAGKEVAAAELLVRLRADPRVRFAESVTAEGFITEP